MTSGRLTGTFLKIAVSSGLLTWFFARTDWNQLGRSFSDVPNWLWPLLLILYLVSQCISTTRWYLLSRVLGFRGKWINYLNYYFSGMFFNLFLPTSIGGDFLKIFLISRGKGTAQKLLASYSVFADRLLGMFALLIIGACTVIVHPGLLPGYLETILKLSGAITLLVLTGAPLLENITSTLPYEIIKKAVNALLAFWKHPSVLILCLFFSLIIQLLCIIICFIAGISMGIDVPAALYFAAFPMVAIFTMLPVSLNGIGVREGGFIYFMGLYGVSETKAIGLSLAFFAIQVAASLIGGVVYSTGSYKKTEIHP